MPKSGRKPVLDEIKKREILAILSVGCSRQSAANYVGCDPKTIQNTADRDPQFAKQLARAGHQQELTYLRSIQQAALSGHNWRAAAWALERINPERYGKRGPDVVTLDQLRDLMAQFSEIIVEEIPARYRKAVIKRLDGISSSLKDAPKNSRTRR